MGFILGRQQRKGKIQKNDTVRNKHTINYPPFTFEGSRVGPGPEGDILASLRPFHEEMHIGAVPVPITT